MNLQPVIHFKCVVVMVEEDWGNTLLGLKIMP